jgi:alkaline phosphatase
VLLGGGRRWFLPSTDTYSSRAESNDYAGLPADLLAGWRLPASAAGAIDTGRDLISDFQAAGFTYVNDAAGLQAALAHHPKKLLGLFAYGNMNVALDKISARRYRAGQAGYSDRVVQDHLAPDQPMLDEMTDAALSVLRKDRQGFALMVEGAHIAKQSHQMDAEPAIGEVIEFDRAIGRALDFARADGHTLVLITADHECAGFSLIGGLTTTVAGLQALPSDAATLDPATAPKRQGVVGVRGGGARRLDSTGPPLAPARVRQADSVDPAPAHDVADPDLGPPGRGRPAVDPGRHGHQPPARRRSCRSTPTARSSTSAVASPPVW